MNATEIQAVDLLNKCTFMPGSTAKRFVRQMHSLPNKDGYKLSPKQKEYLWKLVHMYRRQHRDKWFIDHAAMILMASAPATGNILKEIVKEDAKKLGES